VVNVAVGSSVFQSTPLREGRQKPFWPLLRLPKFQSTPLREGRPLFLNLFSTKVQSFHLREPYRFPR